MVDIAVGHAGGNEHELIGLGLDGLVAQLDLKMSAQNEVQLI